MKRVTLYGGYQVSMGSWTPAAYTADHLQCFTLWFAMWFCSTRLNCLHWWYWPGRTPMVIQYYCYPVRICAAGFCVWSHRFVCVYVAKKTDCLRTYCLKISHWCNLLLTHRVINQKWCLLCQVICPGKEIRRHYINRMGKGSRKIVLQLVTPHLSSTCNAASYAMLLQLQCRPVQYRLGATETVCIDST